MLIDWSPTGGSASPTVRSDTGEGPPKNNTYIHTYRDRERSPVINRQQTVCIYLFSIFLCSQVITACIILEVEVAFP